MPNSELEKSVRGANSHVSRMQRKMKEETEKREKEEKKRISARRAAIRAAEAAARFHSRDILHHNYFLSEN